MFWELFVAFGIMMGYIMGAACKLYKPRLRLPRKQQSTNQTFALFSSCQCFLPSQLAPHGGKPDRAACLRVSIGLLWARVTAVPRIAAAICGRV